MLLSPLLIRLVRPKAIRLLSTEMTGVSDFGVGREQAFYRCVLGKGIAARLCTHWFQLQLCTQNLSCYKMHNTQTILAQQLILHSFTLGRLTNQRVLLTPYLGKEKHDFYSAVQVVQLTHQPFSFSSLISY